MSYANFDVSGLSAYVEQNKDLLIKNVLFGKGTRSRISIQTGVKYKEHLHVFEIDPVFGDNSDCGWNPAGSVAVNEREIEVAPLNVQMEICPKNLRGTYAEYLIRFSAEEHPIPFEQYIMDGAVDAINRKIEVALWLGDKVNASSDPVKKWFNGFIALAQASVTGGTGVVAVNITSGKTAYEGLKEVYAAIPAIARRKGAEIYVAPEIFDSYMQDLVALNLYHYNPGNEDLSEFKLPGTNVLVVSTFGLTGSLKVLATYPKNLFYGTDGENDEEIVELTFRRPARVWDLDVEWNSGAQIAFLDQVVLGTFAAAPAATAAPTAAINTIATGVSTIATNSANIKDYSTDIAGIDTAVTGLNAADKVFKTQEQQG